MITTASPTMPASPSLARTLRRHAAVLGCAAALSAFAATPLPAAPPAFDVLELTVADAHAGFLAGRFSARQLTQAYLDRIAAYDLHGPAIRCIVAVNPNALADADRLDAELARTGKLAGPLHGVPVLVKDEIDVAGMATTQGTVVFKDYVTPLDAFVVARLRAAGAIILAKTTLSEFAGGDTYSALTGHSRNPYALDCTVGGSSGGSGGALAANFGLLALGEETSSSLKRPAAWGALAGLRPTPGLISRTGMWDGHPVPTAQMGPMTRTVGDLARLMDIMVGYDPEDPITAFGLPHTPRTYTAYLDVNGLKGARIGVIREAIGSGSRPDSDDFKKVDALFQKALADLQAAGATVVDVKIPDLRELQAKRGGDPALTAEALRVYLARNPNSPFKNQADIDAHPAMATSFKAIVAQYRAEHPESAAAGGVGYTGGRGRTGGGRTADPARILEGIRAREQLLQNMAKAMADARVTALAYKAVEHQPTLIAEATTPPYRSNGGVVSLNTFLIHTPTITVPMGFTTDGIPTGLAFLGLPFSDADLIKLAYAYEQTTRHRRPPAATPALAHRPGTRAQE
jgi:Asp-tRNA(Asn)/Glu-tRNA(Gln) amidotransferase A subunit family amidase